MPVDIQEKYRTDLRTLLTQEPCKFAKETVRCYQKLKEEIDPFITDTIHMESADVDVRMVVGSDHGAYVDSPWSSLILSGKRSDTRLDDLAKNPEYYLSPIEGEHRPNFAKIGDDIFIVCGGNNRTIIAKFFFYYNQDKIPESLLRNVSLTEYRVDWDALETKKAIDSILNHPRFEHLTLTLTTDTFANRAQDKYRWHLSNSKLGGEDGSIKLTKEELPALLKGLQTDSFIKRLLGLDYSKHFRTNIFF